MIKNLFYMNKKYFSKLLKKYNNLDNLLIELYENDKSNDILVNLNINNIYDLINYLELLIPDKNKNGITFTPIKVVDKMINNLDIKYNSKIFDPSCGYSTFLIKIIELYINKFNKPINDILKENIFGCDIIENNIIISKKLIYILAKEYNQIIDDNFNLYNDDYLKLYDNIKYDFIIGNPPYIKIQDINQDYKEFLIKNFISCKSNFNLYYAFIEKAIKELNENGELIFIIPNSLFYNDASYNLRNILYEKIYNIFDYKFEKIFNVDTYSCIIYINNKINNSLIYETKNEKIKINYNNINNKKFHFLSDDDLLNIYNIENKGIKLKDLFKINYGLATLKDEFYIIDNLELIDNKFYKKNDYFIEKELVKNLIKISDYNNKKMIIFPYYFNNKWICYDEDYVSKYFPEFYKYANANKNLLASRDKNKKLYNPFYSYGRKQGLDNKGLKWMICKFNKYPNFIFDKDENHIVNGYGLFLKEEYYKYINIIDEILNSDIMNYYIKKTSSYIANEYYCYEKNKIENFSIPLDIDNIKDLKKIYDLKWTY